MADRAAVVAEVVLEAACAVRVRQKLAYRLNLVKKCDARSKTPSTYACSHIPTPSPFSPSFGMSTLAVPELKPYTLILNARQYLQQ